MAKRKIGQKKNNKSQNDKSVKKTRNWKEKKHGIEKDKKSYQKRKQNCKKNKKLYITNIHRLLMNLMKRKKKKLDGTDDGKQEFGRE